jgi:hypothetical protein
MIPLDELFSSPFEWDRHKVIKDFKSQFQPRIQLSGRCHPKKRILAKPYEILKCTNYTEFLDEFRIVRIHAQEFFGDWFRYNAFSRETVDRLFSPNESFYGPLSRFLFHPQQELQSKILEIKTNLAKEYSYVIGLHIWSGGFPPNSDVVAVEKTIFECVEERMRAISQDPETRKIGIFVSSDSFEAKIRAAEHFGSIATFIDTSNIQGVKADLVEMWILGSSNEIVTTGGISNFTRAAVGRKQIPVLDGLQCVSHNATAVWARSPESCMIPSKCGKSVKHPWREDHPMWFVLRLMMFLVVPLGVVALIFKWCSDKRAQCR